MQPLITVQRGVEEGMEEVSDGSASVVMSPAGLGDIVMNGEMESCQTQDVTRRLWE